MLKHDERMRVIRGIPQEIHLRLSEVGRQLNVDLRFRYADDLPSLRPGSASIEAVPGQPSPSLKGTPTFIYRHHEAEGQAIKFLRACGLTAGRHGRFTAVGETAWRFLLEQVPRLSQAGWSVSGLDNLIVYRVTLEPSSLTGRILSAEKAQWWLELEVAWGDQRLPAAQVREALAAGRRILPLPDGRYARVPESLAASIEGLFTGLPGVGDRLRIDAARVPLASALLEQGTIDAEPGWRGFVERLQGFEGMGVTAGEPTRLPRTLKGALRPYQEQGVRWLAFLRDYGLGGILADDMGLGKTIEVLALRLAEQEAGIDGAWLVIAPSSVIYNWEAEARRFAPSIRTLMLAGSTRQRLEAEIDASDLVITSYALLRRDLELHLRHRYRFVVLDEAQHIKNPASQTAKAARRLRATHRLALTGTPIENRLAELWSQFSFAMPQLLGSFEAFKQRYVLPIEQERDPARQEELRRRVRPFILRRLKEEVARDLPARTEAVSWCELTGVQRRLYNAVLMVSRQQALEAVDTRGLVRARLTVLSALLRLRQVCCDPHLLHRVEGLGHEAEALLEEYLAQRTHRSAKMQLFHELLLEIVEGGHRVLVFSQFVRMLELLRGELERDGLAYEYLDGSTRDRMARVDRFNAGTAPVFLISLKAGGTGLNLTGADYVIHYDPWWNPAVEAQATDRAHRIGQTRPVFSYKLIARGGIEERMLELQARKRALAEGILDAGMRQALTREDIEFLLTAPGPI